MLLLFIEEGIHYVFPLYQKQVFSNMLFVQA